MITHDGKVYEPVEHELFTTFKELEVPKQTPRLRWKGGKISYELWSQVVGYMLWSQEKYKSEAMITLFYNLESKIWAAWAFPQETAGMTVSMKNESDEFKEQRKHFPHPWIELGSVHHHCTSGAFASSIDQNDEIDRDGIHITLGKLDETVLDIHVRTAMQKNVQPTELATWVEVLDWVNNIPNELGELKYRAFTESLLNKTMFKEVTFPKLWADNLKKKTYPTTVSYHGPTYTPGTTYPQVQPENWVQADFKDPDSKYCARRKEWVKPPPEEEKKEEKTKITGFNPENEWDREWEITQLKQILEEWEMEPWRLAAAVDKIINGTLETHGYSDQFVQSIHQLMRDIDFQIQPETEEYLLSLLSSITYEKK